MNDYVIAHIRTYVPVLVGIVATWLISLGVDVDTAQLAVAITSLATALWYALVRLVAQKWPQVGWLLGYQKAPVYEQ